VQEVGRELLSLASLNSATLLHAEMVGRAYGGGILKLEPKEADLWLVPAASLIGTRAAALRNVKGRVAELLVQGKLMDAVAVVDDVLFVNGEILSGDQVDCIRAARETLASRRDARSSSGR
jgi:hypothetical protein